MDMRRIARKKATRLVKNGRRVYGGIYQLAGQEIYLAWRKTSELFRGGEKLISDAICKHTASWALDDETLLTLRAQGVKYVGVWVMDTDDRFIAPIDYFFDKSRARVFNYESRGGALQRYLPLEHFHMRPGTTRIK